MSKTHAFTLTLCLVAVQLGCSDSSETKTDGPVTDAGPDVTTDVRGLDLGGDLSRDSSTDSSADSPLDGAPLDTNVDQAGVDQSGIDQSIVDTHIDGSPVDQAGIDQATPIDGAQGIDTGSIDGGNPCAACTADQVCVQLNDGTCNATIGLRVQCRTVSQACRTKLASSAVKRCTTISECETELCPQPYRCVYSTPCGNEIPQAAVYCYGV